MPTFRVRQRVVSYVDAYVAAPDKETLQTFLENFDELSEHTLEQFTEPTGEDVDGYELTESVKVADLRLENNRLVRCR